MKLRIFFCITFCALVAPRKAYQNSMAEVIKIAPYGNSITQAASDHQSYRYPLWKKLIDANISFDFVGTMNTNNGGNPSRPDYKGKPFDMDHEGHWGWRADEILNSVSSWLTKYTPDMVLMHVGTNDCIQAQTTSTTISEITQIVTKLRTDNPAVVIFMASLIPCNASGASSYINDLNNSIKSLASQLNTQSSPIIHVDQNTGIDAAKDLYDGVHPGSTGEEKMAQKWFDAINKYLTTTRSNMNVASQQSDLSANEPAHQLYRVCTSSSMESGALLPITGSISNLLGKKVLYNMGTGSRTNGVYIFSEPTR
jgi:hypothetical protein